ncbi:MAG: hypothetical protein ABWX84_06130 [Nocardioides sp.]
MSIDDLLTRELATVARGVEPPPAPVDQLVARGREARRRSRWYAAGAAAAAAAVVLGVVWSGATGGGDDARRQDPAGPAGDLPTGALPQVPIQVGTTTYVDGRALAEKYGPLVGDGQGGVALVPATRRWRVLTEPGEPELPAGTVGSPAPHPDGDRVAYVDRTGTLELWSYDGTRDQVISGPTPARESLLAGMDSSGNVYVTALEDPAAPPRVWNLADERDRPVTYAGAPVSLVGVTGAGLLFSTEPGGEHLLGVPDATGAIVEARGVPDATLAVSASGDRVAWLTDTQEGADGRLPSVTVEKLVGPPGRVVIDLPDGTGAGDVVWEDETHVLVTLFRDARGTTQSLLRCDLDGACEYAVPPPD